MNYFITDNVIKYFLKYLKNNYLSQSDLSDYSNAINTNSNNIKNLQDTVNSIETLSEELQVNITELNQNKNTVNEQLTKLTILTSDLNTNTINNNQNISEINRKIELLSSQTNDNQTNINNLSEEISQCNKQLEIQQNSLETIQDDIKVVTNLADTVEGINTTLQDQDENLTNLQSISTTQTTEIQDLKKDSLNLYTKLSYCSNNSYKSISLDKNSFIKKKNFYLFLYIIFNYRDCELVLESNSFIENAKYFTKNDNSYKKIEIENQTMFEYFINNFNLYSYDNTNYIEKTLEDTYNASENYYIYFENGYYLEEKTITSDETLQNFIHNNPSTNLYVLKYPTYTPIEYYSDIFTYYINMSNVEIANAKTSIIDLGDYTNANLYNDFGTIDTNFIVNSDTLIQEVYNNFTIERINTVILANKKYWTCTSCGIIPSQLDSNTTEWIYCIFTNEHPNELDVNNFDMTNFNFITSRVLGVYSYTNNKSYFKTI